MTKLINIHKHYKISLYTITTIILLMLLIGFCSCTRNGYGCKGNGKYITRVRE